MTNLIQLAEVETDVWVPIAAVVVGSILTTLSGLAAAWSTRLQAREERAAARRESDRRHEIEIKAARTDRRLRTLEELHVAIDEWVENLGEMGLVMRRILLKGRPTDPESNIGLSESLYGVETKINKSMNTVSRLITMVDDDEVQALFGRLKAEAQAFKNEMFAVLGIWNEEALQEMAFTIDRVEQPSDNLTSRIGWLRSQI